MSTTLHRGTPGDTGSDQQRPATPHGSTRAIVIPRCATLLVVPAGGR